MVERKAREKERGNVKNLSTQHGNCNVTYKAYVHTYTYTHVPCKMAVPVYVYKYTQTQQ